jgi:uncharacterized protein (UPF0261 family)
MPKTILLMGAFDTKGEEYEFIKKLIESQECNVLSLNWGVYEGTNRFPIDIDNTEIASAGGGNLSQLQDEKDERAAMDVMSRGVAVVVERLFKEGKFDGIFCIGKERAMRVAGSAMRTLPIGVPKVIVSTVAARNPSEHVGTKDINLFPSVVDVSGINRISEKIFNQAVGAVCGMVKINYKSDSEEKPIVAATMFGQTKPCVEYCRRALNAKGYEFLVFHANGTGGRTMESMVEEGFISAVLDITPTEWADELCGGVFRAGEQRLEAPGRAEIPHLIVPGCMDMVNFGPIDTVPKKYKDRLLYAAKPTVTLMRTNIEENIRLGEILAQKANAAKGRVIFLFPLRGLSRFNCEGGIFWWPEADQALFDAIKKNLKPGIEVIELDYHINDEAFAQRLVEDFLANMEES